MSLAHQAIVVKLNCLNGQELLIGEEKKHEKGILGEGVQCGKQGQ